MIDKAEFSNFLTRAIDGEEDIFCFLKSIKGIEVESEVERIQDCVTEKFKSLLNSKPIDWMKLQYLVLAASEYPTKKHTKYLCDILREKSEEMTNEDVVELLQEIGSCEAIPALVDILDLEIEGDHFHELNRKCLLALDRLGSSNA